MSWKKLFRRKIIDRNEVSSELNRVLSTVDLTLLGIGSTLGLGIYVLAGQVAKLDAGPAVVISFLVAAIASVLAGLCYAEFGARVPKAGSAYVYSYVCVGEVIAFIVGWNLVMEYVIGVASVSKAYSGYVDSTILDHAMSRAFKDIASLNVTFLSEYFDFFSFGITIILTLLLMFGVKESSVFNNIFTILNLLVMFFVIIGGGLYANLDNWTVDPKHPMECKNISSHSVTMGKVGSGGFAPFGYSGIMTGAATCFYGFIGFDVIATTSEEAKNPRRAIPLSIVLSLLFVFIAYFGISTVLTMMVPYYCQYEDAPLPFAFEYNGFTVGKWIVTIGALFALATSLLGSMFPMPRIIYSMARDGLLFNFLAKVHPRFQTPIWATLLGGLLGAVMGALFNLASLIDMMSIGTLTAYTLVALCVLMLRYRKDEQGADDTGFNDSEEPVTLKMWFRQIFNLEKQKVPTKLSTQYTTSTVVIYCVLCFAFCGTAVVAEQHEDGLTPEVLALLGIFGALLFLELVSLSLQPISRLELTFKVPLVPWIPGLSILVNTYLILQLSWETWVRFAIWMVVGLVIYLYCLCSGRADRTYNASYEEYQNSLKKESSTKPKSLLQGIDNPALVYEDEDGSTNQEKPQPKKTENDFQAKKGPNNEATDAVKTTKSILFKPQQKSAESLQKSEALPPSPPTPPIVETDPILKIHESNQFYLNQLDVKDPKTPQDMVDSVISAAIREAEAMKNNPNNYPKEAQQIVDQVVSLAEQQDILQRIHRACQDCLNANSNNGASKSQPILSLPSDRQETQSFLQNHLRKSLIKNQDEIVPPNLISLEGQDEGGPLGEVKAEDAAKRLEYMHMVAQLSLNGVNIDSIPWLLHPPSTVEKVADANNESQNTEENVDPVNIEETMAQLRLKGVNIESIPWSIGAVPEKEINTETDELHDRDKTISQLIQNGVNIESIPWSIDDSPIRSSEELIIKELSNQLKTEPDSKRPEQLSLTPEQFTEIIRLHENAKKLMKGQAGDVGHDLSTENDSTAIEGTSLLDIHERAQRSINEVNTHAAPSPANPSAILEIHNLAQEVLLTQDQPEELNSSTETARNEVIHKIAQLCLRGVNVGSVPWLDPILSSDEERAEIKKLNERMIASASKSTNLENSPVPPRFSPSAEQIAKLLEIHSLAQDVLRISKSQPNDDGSTNKELEASSNKSADLENVDKIIQLCLNGISVPWLRPVLSSNEEKEEIKQLNKRATEEAIQRASSLNKVAVQKSEMSPTHVQQAMERLAEVHRIAQDCFQNKVPKSSYSESRGNKISVSFVDPPKIEDIITAASSLASHEAEDEQNFAKRKLQQRRATGPFLPQLNKLKLDYNRSDSDLTENDDDEEEEGLNLNSPTHLTSEPEAESLTDRGKESFLIKTNEEPQAATPRKQSIQNKKSAMDDLIAIFEQGK